MPFFRRLFLLFVIGMLFVGCARSLTPRIDAADGRARVAKGALLVDVRSAEEFRAGHVPGAVNIPHTEIEQRLSELGAPNEKDIVLYCGSGRRAGIAQEALVHKGFERVFNAGGYSEWQPTGSSAQ